MKSMESYHEIIIIPGKQLYLFLFYLLFSQASFINSLSTGAKN